ncbi:3-deoxy-D-manno-octulosonic acid transferase [Pseudooctadecabacter jejudonensis]|uniref:3-deoxy-D-manno-octulosonic acid transferase n=1 Tax=Pseudooctadecabacter jejudonensis TaxID=1391910 RepID=A0A1Y5SMN0_9RHOB|nr:3-deoxy-D-manno-octulosonic acid transferase [Pseudooctadecabacter jejudonensis]SLN43089.1 3-deoxy-D-manno-octulosonic acid transferase [Pseudooctadecabacter jejudonensis]
MILRVFSITYRLIWLVLTPLVLVYIWHRGRRDPDYRAHLGERFGHYPDLPQNGIWIHAVSLGEVRSAVPLARALLAKGEVIIFTHFTPAGRREAHKVFADDIAAGRVASVWVPLDMRWVFGRFFRACRPKMGLTMEIEIWPAMVLSARAKGVPLYMCNAQYPSKSLDRDSRNLRLRQKIMGKFAGAFVKSQLQADRFASVAVPNINITGELRFDQPIPPALLTAAEALRPRLTRPVVTFASAVEGEDDIYIDAIKTLVSHPHAPLIVYVPRAPERFDTVAEMLRDAGLSVARRSAVFDADLAVTQWPTPLPDVLLGDSLGEMYFYLSLADRVVVGGGFHPHGAHNIIEPLAVGKPVVTGPTTYTIEYPFVEAEAAGVVKSVNDANELADVLSGPPWTTDRDMRAFMAAHSGAADRTARAIFSEIAGRPNSH